MFRYLFVYTNKEEVSILSESEQTFHKGNDSMIQFHSIQYVHVINPHHYGKTDNSHPKGYQIVFRHTLSTVKYTFKSLPHH